MSPAEIIALGGLTVAILMPALQWLGRSWLASRKSAAEIATEASTVKGLGEAIGRAFKHQEKLSDKLDQHLIDCAREKARLAMAIEGHIDELARTNRNVEQLQGQMRHVAEGSADTITIKQKIGG